MNRFVRHAALPLLASLGLLSAASADMAKYQIVQFGNLGGGYSAAYGLNNLGQVVGESAAADGSIHAFL